MTEVAHVNEMGLRVAGSLQWMRILATVMLRGDRSLRINIARDRIGSFEPLLTPKHEQCFSGFDHEIIARYAREMTIHEIQGFLAKRSSPISRARSSMTSGSPVVNCSAKTVCAMLTICTN